MMTERLELIEESYVRMEGSWGATPYEKRFIKISAWVNPDRERWQGGFEVYSCNEEGKYDDGYYGEGGLWVDDNNYLVDYDGVGSLDTRIIKWLDELGYINPDEKCWFRKQLNEEE